MAEEKKISILTSPREALLNMAPQDYRDQIDAVITLSLKNLGMAYDTGKSGVITMTEEFRASPLWSGLAKKLGDKTTVTFDEMREYVMEGLGVVVTQKNALAAYLDKTTQGEFRDNAEAWWKQNFGEPVSIEEFMTQKNTIDPQKMAAMASDPIYLATLEGIRQQIKDETPSYMLALAPLVDKNPDEGAKALAYIVADNAKQASNTGNMLSYVWQAAREDVEGGTGWLRTIGKLAATVLGDTIVGRWVSDLAGGNYRQRAAEIGIEKVGQSTAHYLATHYHMFEGDAYNVAQNIYRQGMKSQGFEVTSTPFDAKKEEAVRRELPSYSLRKRYAAAQALVAELPHQQAAAPAPAVDTGTPASPSTAENTPAQADYTGGDALGLPGLSTPRDVEAAPAQNAFLQQQYDAAKEAVVGNNEFHYPDILAADLGALGMNSTAEQAKFRTAVGLSQTVEGITTAVMSYFPNVKASDFHADNQDNVYVTINDKNYYLNSSGLSSQDMPRLVMESALMLPVVGWAGRGALAAEAGIVGVRAYRAMSALRTLSAVAATDFGIDRVANAFNGGEPVSAEGLGKNLLSVINYAPAARLGNHLLGQISEKILRGSALTQLERVRAAAQGVDLGELTERLVTATASQMERLAAVRGVAIPAGLTAIAATADAAHVGDPVPYKEVDTSAPLKPEKTPARASAPEPEFYLNGP